MDALEIEWATAPFSRVVLGCGLLGGDDWGRVDEVEAIAAVRAGLDAGITVFDTADVYGLGRSEERLARALGRDRHDVTVVTKGGVAWERVSVQAGRVRTRRDLSRAHLRSAVHQSLRRLALERIPVYLAHWPDEVHSLSEVVETLTELQGEGLIDRIGVSNFSSKEVKESGALDALSVIEVCHNLIENGSDLLEVARGAGLPALMYGVLAQGFLTGKYPPRHNFPKSDQRHRLTQFTQRDVEHEALLRELRAVAAEIGLTPGQTAIRWTLTTVPHGCAIVGARSPHQVRENIAAGGTVLSAEHVQRLNAVALAN